MAITYLPFELLLPIVLSAHSEDSDSESLLQASQQERRADSAACAPSVRGK